MLGRAVVEGAIFSAIGVVFVVQGLHLDPEARLLAILSFRSGGSYTTALGIGLCISGIAHGYLNYKIPSAAERRRVAPNSWMTSVALRMVLVFVLYAVSIEWFGYVAPTFVFLLLEFRLAGVTSWRTNVVVTAVVVTVFYVVFIHYCEMPFPRGVLSQ